VEEAYDTLKQEQQYKEMLVEETKSEAHKEVSVKNEELAKLRENVGELEAQVEEQARSIEDLK
jgi:predicted transcriptional regulator